MSLFKKKNKPKFCVNCQHYSHSAKACNRLLVTRTYLDLVTGVNERVQIEGEPLNANHERNSYYGGCGRSARFYVKRKWLEWR